VGRNQDGTPFSVGGEILEVDPPKRFVHTWKAAWDGNQVTTVAYQLDPIPEGTRVTLRHEGFAGRPASCEGHTQGWERVLGWLTSHLVPSTRPMKFVLSYETAPDKLPLARELFPAHRARLDAFHARGALLWVGAWENPLDGAMAVFTSRAEAEAFVREDPFVLQGVVSRHLIRGWNEIYG
jgi:uncharacterized protein YciI